uniref:Uncharacterized protein n=1 Tax=Panagrolaimus davidi TaxID=227884 RepID=A0A914QS78_9BILA
MVWSADNLKVVIGATMKSNCIRSPSAKRNDFFVSYHVLGFHDCEKYWRVPDVPDEMYDSKNFLIEIGVPLWGEEASSKKFHPPPFLREISIEGRYLSNRFIKHAENERIPEEKVEEDDYYVTYSCAQISREQ